MSDYIFVYITNPNLNHAQKLGKVLVEEKLAACINIFPKIESIYWWQGKLITDTEAVLIAKTKREFLEKLKDRVLEMHEYTCPCIVTLDIPNGYKDFLKWIDKELYNEEDR